MFDCVLPSRNARHGMLYTREGIINITNARWRNNFSLIDERADGAPTSQAHTKAYLHHLFRVNELLGPQLSTLHNLAFYLALVREAREHILQGDFAEWKMEVLPGLEQKL